MHLKTKALGETQHGLVKVVGQSMAIHHLHATCFAILDRLVSEEAAQAMAIHVRADKDGVLATFQVNVHDDSHHT